MIKITNIINIKSSAQALTKTLLASIFAFALVATVVLSSTSIANASETPNADAETVESLNDITTEVDFSQENLEFELDQQLGLTDEAPVATPVEESAPVEAQTSPVGFPVNACPTNESVEIKGITYDLSNTGDHKAIVSHISQEAGATIGVLNYINVARSAQCADYAGVWTVTGIGYRAARGNLTVTTAYLPETLRSIGTESFLGSSIADVSFPSGSQLEVIAPYAFAYTHNLQSFVLPDSTNEILEGAFAASSALTNFYINPWAQLKNIGYKAFIYNKQLKHIALPVYVNRIDQYAFAVTGLKSIVFEGHELTTIEPYTFAYDHDLQYFAVPNSVRSIEFAAFAEAKLDKLFFDPYWSQLQNIAEKAFAYSTIGHITLPDSLTEIGPWSFADAHIGCLLLPQNLKYIPTGAFAYNKIEQVWIPASVTEIAPMAFGATDVQFVHFLGLTPPVVHSRTEDENELHGSFGNGDPLLIFSCPGFAPATVSGEYSGYKAQRCQKPAN